MDRQCSGITKAGGRCKSWALPGSAFCISHDPERVVELAEYRRRGGKGKSNKARARKALPAELMSMEEIQSYLGVVLKGVIGGRIEPGVGTAVANIARAMTTVAGVASFEDQLADMAAEIAMLRDERQGA